MSRPSRPLRSDTDRGRFLTFRVGGRSPRVRTPYAGRSGLRRGGETELISEAELTSWQRRQHTTWPACVALGRKAAT